VTAASFAVRRVGALASALLLTSTVLLAHGSDATAQQRVEFSDLDQTTHAESIRLVAEDGITGGYPDGTFRPREDVRRDQMATFLARALRLDPRPASFPDVPSDSVHAQNVGAIAHAGITSGFADGTYRPLEFVTRGQMATFLAAGLNLPPGSASFDDVPSGYVHARAIAALASSGITAGFPDGTYRPNQLVKRDQMAAFLARGIPLPRQPEEPEEPACPGSGRAATAASSPRGADGMSERRGASEAATTATERDSEDLEELTMGDVTAAAGATRTDSPAAPTQNLGPAIPGVAFPLTSVIRTSPDTLEVHSQDLPNSRGARVDESGGITATTTVPAGRRTWATARIGSTVYVGQWGTGDGPNLYRYSATARGSRDRTAQEVATVPAGGEFWALTEDARGRLWAGTRAHNSGSFRAETGLGDGRDDGRHVVHRIAPSSGLVTNVTFCVPAPPTTAGGVRPDIKQLASVGDTLYVGTGQQTAGARLYAFEPRDRADVPPGQVRDLTPASVRSASGVFAMAASEGHIAFGTQASSGESARLVVLDRRTEQVRVDVPLVGESRVDAVALRGDRVVATGFSGVLYDTAIPGSGVQQEAEAHDSPVVDQFHRFIEIRSDGSLRGVTQKGVVWTRTTTGAVDRVNLVDTGAPVAPGLPHALHAGPADIAVGGSSVVTLRSTNDAAETPRTVNVAGEAKALTDDAATGDTYIATYPNAGLWRIEAGGDGAEQVGAWTAAFRRPADADLDDRRGRVNVVARDENAAQSESRPISSGQANFQFRPSHLFPILPTDPTDPVAPPPVTSGWPLGRPAPQETPVEASAVLSGDTPGGSEVYVGDTRGGVQRIDASDGRRQWYRDADEDDRYRRVVDIELVDGRLVVVSTGALAPRGGGPVYGHRTIVRIMDPATGAVEDTQIVRNSAGNSFAVGDAVTSGPVTVLTTRTSLRFYDRTVGSYVGYAHDANDSFGGPYVTLERGTCQLYHLENVPSDLVRTLVELGACLPEDPIDPGR
jgi:hypothetical protein